jgi:hypothetical protein
VATKVIFRLLKQILFDHGKEEELDLASCKVDWVQPNALTVAASARNELTERTKQQRAALTAQGNASDLQVLFAAVILHKPCFPLQSKQRHGFIVWLYMNASACGDRL